MLKPLFSSVMLFGFLAGIAPPARSRLVNLNGPSSLASDLKVFVATPAISGYEGSLASEILERLRAYSPSTDRLGDVIITVGTGSPRRLIVAPMDEPGYVVSHITQGGYLQLQRLPQFAILPLFNELYSAQPVGIETASGKWIPGVVAGLSIHLMPGRTQPPNPEEIGNMYVDVGASTAASARDAGAELLSPVVIDRQLYQLGDQEWGGAAVGDRFGDAALAELLRRLDPAKLRGTTAFAFVAQQWSGARGLERVLTRYKPDELIYIGRLLPGRGLTGEARPAHFPTEAPGSGVLVGVADLASPLAGFAAQLEHIAQQNEIRITPDYSAPLMPASYLPTPPLPGRTVHLAIATAWPSTPAETVNANDLIDLVMLLEDYLQGRSVRPALSPAQVLAPPAPPPRPRSAPSPEAVLRDLTECYGVSGHEADVRNTVRRLLPSWARPSTDPAGNLILRVASAPASARAPHILIDAHLDEIGFQVRMILPNGRLAVESLGGFLPYYYLGHSCFIHTSQGIRPGVMELPKGWHSPGFTWSQGRNAIYRVDAGAASAAAAGQLGIHVGDFITVPKKYRRLAGTRATVRSMDDRVGDAALVAAAWALGPNLKNRNIVFMWSTGEELGLVGAAKAAARWAAEKRTPDYVFAVDTFVSADSPLESKRFADAPLGAGFVVRAVDNSNIVPRPLVERLLRLARQNHIPAQDGVTGGGNDGAAFLRYGSVDVALGWPMRYSHSPAEEIDTRDLDALARIIVVVSRNW